MKKHACALIWFITGFALGTGAVVLSVASVPRTRDVTDDAVLYQEMSEIKKAKEKELSFDQDIQKLSKMEASYAEVLPQKDSKRSKKRKRARL